MQQVAQTILAAPDTRVFVFPSEITASFWRRKYLDGSVAVRADRFISWDTFKENTFELTQVLVPVNRLVRLLFAADLLKQNASGPRFLDSVILPAQTGSWKPFVQSTARMLPILEQLMKEEDVVSQLSARYRKDLGVILARYREFLDRHGLFEPAFEPIVPGKLERSYVVFFPSVIQDFDDFAPFFDLERVSVVESERADPGTMHAYLNSRQEIRAFCMKCRELLDGGINPSEIAVTLAVPEGYVEELRDEAALFDLPLVFRIGRPLAEYPVVRLYQLLSAIIVGGYNVSSLKRLFLNSVFPWRNPDTGRSLVSFGIKHFGVQNYTEGGTYRDLWEEKLKRGREDGLLNFYRTLKRSVESVVGASTFEGLRRSVLIFNNQFLDTERLGGQQERPFSAARDELAKLQETAHLVPSLDVESPFALWMTSLSDRTYVQAIHSGGIPVYEYRVAAGIRPTHHFILGAAQEAVSVKLPRYSFLPVNMLPEKFRNEGDFSRAFQDLYLVSGGKVSFSYAVEGFGGPNLPPDYFLLSGSVTEADDGWLAADPYRLERSSWTGACEVPATVFGIQRAGAGAMAATSFLDGGFDLSLSPITDGDLNAAVIQRQMLQGGACDGTRNGEIRISPTALDLWSVCRFSYFLSRVLNLNERDFDAEYVSPREAGIILHRVFAEVTLELDRYFEGKVPAEAEQYLDRAAKVVEESLDEWRGPRFLPPVWVDQRRRVEECVAAFLNVELDLPEGARIREVEQTLEIPSFGPGVTLHGRIDRISERDGAFIIVDYKKRLWKKRSGMVTPDGALLTYQVPCYVLLVENRYGPVKDALYYDMTKNEYSSVFGGRKPWFDDQEKKDLEKQTLSAIADMSASIEKGTYNTPKPRGSCAGCDFRPICREKFVVRQ